MAALKWSVLRSLGTAIRTAARPGSPSMGERLASLPRLVSATLRGEYRGTTVSRLFLLAAAVAYIVSPVDLVPEAFLTIFGLADDAFVLTWLAAAVVNETESFLAWERTQPHRAARAQTADPRRATVDGTVLR